MCVINKNDVKFGYNSFSEQKKKGGARPLHFDMPVTASIIFKNHEGKNVPIQAGGFTEEGALKNLSQIAELHRLYL